MERPVTYIRKLRPHECSFWHGRRPLLGHLDIELTERCNNDCIHCYINQPMDSESARQREMTTDDVKGILTEAAVLGCLSVRFTGGEPLLREDFDEIYLFARRQGMKVILFTNARLVTPRLADLLARFPPGESVEVTVFGMTPHSYEAVSRAPGSYAEFRSGVALLLDRRVRFVVKGALLPPNRNEMHELEAWASTIPAMDKRPSYSMCFDLRGRRDSEVKSRQIARLRITPKDGVAVMNRDRRTYLRDMRQFCSRFMGPPGDRLFPCGAGRGICVDAYGRAQMCMALRDPGMVYDLSGEGRGSNGHASLRKALTEYFPGLRKMRAGNPEYSRRCARCFLKGLCEQCPAKSWIEHGTLDTPVDYLCQVAHARARDLGLLDEDENAWDVTDAQARLARTDWDALCAGTKVVEHAHDETT
jgi:radical SAM protein with 4Fe4S-binding SPASM domain